MAVKKKLLTFIFSSSSRYLVPKDSMMLLLELSLSLLPFVVTVAAFSS